MASSVLIKCGHRRMKTCNVCHATKPLHSFGVRKPSPDGLSYTCVDCARERTRRFREAHPTHHAEWYRANRQRKADYWSQWYQQHKPQRAQSYAAWVRANPGAAGALHAKRRAAEMSATPRWADL